MGRAQNQGSAATGDLFTVAVGTRRGIGVAAAARQQKLDELATSSQSAWGAIFDDDREVAAAALREHARRCADKHAKQCRKSTWLLLAQINHPERAAVESALAEFLAADFPKKKSWQPLQFIAACERADVSTSETLTAAAFAHLKKNANRDNSRTQAERTFALTQLLPADTQLRERLLKIAALRKALRHNNFGYLRSNEIPDVAAVQLWRDAVPWTKPHRVTDREVERAMYEVRSGNEQMRAVFAPALAEFSTALLAADEDVQRRTLLRSARWAPRPVPELRDAAAALTEAVAKLPEDEARSLLRKTTETKVRPLPDLDEYGIALLDRSADASPVGDYAFELQYLSAVDRARPGARKLAELTGQQWAQQMQASLEKNLPRTIRPQPSDEFVARVQTVVEATLLDSDGDCRDISALRQLSTELGVQLARNITGEPQFRELLSSYHEDVRKVVCGRWGARSLYKTLAPADIAAAVTEGFRSDFNTEMRWPILGAFSVSRCAMALSQPR